MRLLLAQDAPATQARGQLMQVNWPKTAPAKVKRGRHIARPSAKASWRGDDEASLDVLTSSVIWVTSDTTVRDAAKLPVQHRISAMLVVDGDGNLVGMVSEGDLVHRTEIETEKPHRLWWLDLLDSDRDAGDYVKSHGLTVAAVMTHEVVCAVDSHAARRGREYSRKPSHQARARGAGGAARRHRQLRESRAGAGRGRATRFRTRSCRGFEVHHVQQDSGSHGWQQSV